MCYIAIENDHRNSGFTQLENGGSFHTYVSLPEGKPPFSYGFSYGFSIFLWFFHFPMVFPWVFL